MSRRWREADEPLEMAPDRGYALARMYPLRRMIREADPGARESVDV